MKTLLILVFALLTINSFSQRKVSGIIIFSDGTELVGARILEVGTNNETIANQEGKFSLKTIKDTCLLDFSFIGLETKTIKITNDTSINLTLEIQHYEYHWITIGTNYDVINSTFGCSISNGLDENPLIDFEEFSDDWMYKISGSTDFRKDYSFETKITYKYLRLLRVQPSIEYIHTNYWTKNYKFSDLNMSIGYWLKRIQSDLKIQFGYQTLNDFNNFGAGVGLQKRIKIFYCGFMVGYRFDYYTYEIYSQCFIYKHTISLRANYERLDDYDFFTIGLAYSFTR